MGRESAKRPDRKLAVSTKGPLCFECGHSRRFKAYGLGKRVTGESLMNAGCGYPPYPY